VAGLIASCKKSIAPYLELMRLQHSTGTFLVLFPSLWAIGLPSEGHIPFLLFAIFALGAFVMRSAGCVINDIVDRKIDARIERTQNRPIPSGRITLGSAVFLFIVLLLIGFGLLLTLNTTAIMLGAVILIPVLIYPFMKRITYWPQAFLGLTINWGVIVGWAAVAGSVTPSAIMLYIACFFWTLGYDTLYAYQDIKDDTRHGVKSLAIKLGRRGKQYIGVFYAIAFILLWFVGIVEHASLTYTIFLLLGAFQLFWQVAQVNLDNPADCKRKFRSNAFFGLLIFIGVLTTI